MKTSEERHDDGFALATVLMASLLLTVLAIAAYTVSQQSIVDSTRVRSDSTAFQAASSGLDRAVSSFTTASVPGTWTQTIGGGTYTVTVTKSGGNAFVDQYLFTSVGTVNGRTSTVRQQLNYSTLDLWGVEVSGDPKDQKGAFGSGNQFNAKEALLEGPFYVAGDVSINSNVTIRGGPWFVTGSSPDGTTVEFKGGTMTDSTQTLYTNLQTAAARAGTGWMGSASYPCPDVTLPYLDPAFITGAYAKAVTESSDNILGNTGSPNTEVSTTGSPSTYSGTKFPGSSSPCYKIVSPSSVIAAPAMWDLTSGRTNYTLGSSSFGRTTDDFALVGGVLYVRGTVFIDGNLTINSGVTSYQGFGTLVVNGDVTLTGNTLQPTGADPNSHVALTLANHLGLVASGDITTDLAPFEGTMFANHTVNIGMNAHIYGTIHGASIVGGVKSQIIVEAGINSQSVPPCMPGGGLDPRPAVAAGADKAHLGAWARE